MRYLAKLALFTFVGCFFFSGCTVYTEKQTESLSQAVYATKDSIDCGRFDLADEYSTQSTRIVKPPKKRIEILPIYKSGTPDSKQTVASKTPTAPTPTITKPASRTVVIPPRFGNDPVVVVGTLEYEQLLQDNRVATQLRADYDNLKNLKVNLDVELQKQYEMRDKMVEEIIVLQKKLVEKDLALLRRNILIVALVSSLGVGLYLRLRGIL
jgi:hypothetical protein